MLMAGDCRVVWGGAVRDFCFARTLNWQQPATSIELVYTILQFAGCRPKQSPLISIWLILFAFSVGL